MQSSVAPNKRKIKVSVEYHNFTGVHHTLYRLVSGPIEIWIRWGSPILRHTWDARSHVVQPPWPRGRQWYSKMPTR